METLQLDCQETGGSNVSDGDCGTERKVMESDVTIEWCQVGEKNNLKCDLCEKIFSSNHYLQHHVNYVHSDEKNFNCQSCNKSFKAPNHLKLHVQRIHNNNKRYFCNQCSSSFGLEYDLKTHKKTHMANLQFMCQFCDKILATKRGLEEHRRTHTYERPHLCLVGGCGLRFGQKKTLRVHMRSEIEYLHFWLL